MENVRDRYVVAGHDNLVSFCGLLSPLCIRHSRRWYVLFCLFSSILVLFARSSFSPFLRAFAFLNPFPDGGRYNR